MIPQLALFDVAVLKLPALGGIVETGLQPLALLLFADMQKEFEDGRSALAEHAFELVDLVVALLPDLVVNELMDAHH